MYCRQCALYPVTLLQTNTHAKRKLVQSTGHGSSWHLSCPHATRLQRFPQKTQIKTGDLQHLEMFRLCSIQSRSAWTSVRLRLFADVVKALFIVTAVSVSGVNAGLVPCRYRACDLAPCLQLASSAPLSATTQHVFFTVRTSRFGF